MYFEDTLGTLRKVQTGTTTVFETNYKLSFLTGICPHQLHSTGEFAVFQMGRSGWQPQGDSFSKLCGSLGIEKVWRSMCNKND